MNEEEDKKKIEENLIKMKDLMLNILTDTEILKENVFHIRETIVLIKNIAKKMNLDPDLTIFHKTEENYIKDFILERKNLIDEVLSNFKHQPLKSLGFRRKIALPIPEVKKQDEFYIYSDAYFKTEYKNGPLDYNFVLGFKALTHRHELDKKVFSNFKLSTILEENTESLNKNKILLSQIETVYSDFLANYNDMIDKINEIYKKIDDNIREYMKTTEETKDILNRWGGV